MKPQEKIWLSSPHMGGRERDFVSEAFDTNWVSPVGPHIAGFEQDLAGYLGNGSDVVALSAGTAALHLALVLLDVQRGDEVICQTLTFSASANPIVYQGATPVFVDSEPETWNMSPEWLEEAIRNRLKKGKRVKAIVAVHLYGMPAKMAEINAIAARYGIPVVEDAAEGLGAHYQGRALGTLGDLGILSFNGNKIITTSGGGALVAKNTGWIERARYLSTQAREPAPHYEHTTIGYNYRMSNICAGIGRGQMLVLDQRVRERRANFEWYRAAFDGIPGLSFQPEPTGSYSNRWLTAVLVDPLLTAGGVTREDLRLAMEKVNIESRPLWKPMHCQPVFKDCPYYGADTAQVLFEKGLCLPSGSNLVEAQLQRVKDQMVSQLVKRMQKTTKEWGSYK